MRVLGGRETARAIDAAAREAGQLIPMWAVHAGTLSLNQQYGSYQQEMERETAALAELSRWEDRKAAGLSAAAADLAAGKVPAVLDWTVSDDGSKWRMELPDGRTAVIERLDDGESFLPTVRDRAGDCATGPVCAGLLAAAFWVSVQVTG